MTSSSHLEEHCISSEHVLDGSFLAVHRDVVRLPDGQQASREYIRHPGAAMIIPVLADGRVVVVRQYRYPLKQVFVEFPAGKIDRGEHHRATALRELHEETGYRAGKIEHLTTIHNAIAYSDEHIELYVATELTLAEQRLDAGEFLDVEIVSLEWMLTELQAHRLTDVKTQIGVFWLARIRGVMGPPTLQNGV
jgi:ADP-ribose pyrophosphatase